MSVVECGWCAIFICGSCEHKSIRKWDATPFCNKCGSGVMHRHPRFHRAGGTACKRKPKEGRKDPASTKTPGIDWRRRGGRA